MAAAMAGFLISLIDYTCILLVIVYCVTRTPFFYRLLKDRENRKYQFILTLLFGTLSCGGSIITAMLSPWLISISMVGPITGALIGGIRVGIGAGLLGATTGYIATGAISQVAIACAGGLAGLYSLYKREAHVKIREAVFIVLGYEFFVQVFLLIFDQKRPEINAYIPATAVASVLGVTGILFIVEKLIDEREISAAKELIESELRIARNIQMGIVPKVFPPFPDLSTLGLFAVLKPAREVGGDLYDFFRVDENHFFFAIGDVSGKGMAAALFMAVARTLLKANSEPGILPDVLLGRVNDILCRENDASMFVTLFCGILDLTSGEVIYSNAGHNPPYLYRAAGGLEIVSLPEGMALGVMEDIPFGRDRLVLERGDAIVIYTDGVNEAMDVSYNQYSNKRLEDVIRSSGSTHSKTIINLILDDVERFVGIAEQSDDITILCLTYTPEQSS